MHDSTTVTSVKADSRRFKFGSVLLYGVHSFILGTGSPGRSPRLSHRPRTVTSTFTQAQDGHLDSVSHRPRTATSTQFHTGPGRPPRLSFTQAQDGHLDFHTAPEIEKKKKKKTKRRRNRMTASVLKQHPNTKRFKRTVIYLRFKRTAPEL